ncbi:MAG TPA: hypothetical protein VFN67_24405 [Polyangiales bacterium]|nr:hypothetical protein [Polyangiales bacterium]
MRNLLVASLFCAACAAETPGESVQVRWVLDQDERAQNTDFDTDTGYRVHLEQARVELASVYLYAPPSARSRAIAWLEHSLVSVAHAHGGVDNEKGRRVLAEWTKLMNIDALASSAVELSEAAAEGGVVDAVKLELKKGAVAHVRGSAERDGKHWRFEAEVNPDEALARTVELIELDETLEADSVVHVSVQPKAWLSLCDFSRLGEGATDAEAAEVVQLSTDDQVGRALSIGVRSPNAFRVYLEEGGHAH